MKVNTLADSPAYVCEYSVSRCEVRVSGVLEEFAELREAESEIWAHGGNKPGTCLLPGMCFTFWKEGFYEARQRVTDTERTDL